MAEHTWAGKAAVVTGGASGIGRALGVELAARGAHVVLADLDGDAAAAAAGGLPTHAAGSTVGRALDVRDARAVEALVAEVADRWGALDLMVNNAGISLGGRTHLMPPEHWQRTIEVNLIGVVNGVLAAYPRMVAQGHGHVVNMASMAGLAPTPLTVAYTMTKHGVVGLSTTLRIEAAMHGVRVTVVCPGSIDTPILDKGPSDDLPPAPAGTLRPRQFLEKVHQRPMPVDRFARQALRGIERNRAIVIVPRSGHGLWWLQRISPPAFGRLAGILARRVVRDLPEA